MLVTLDHNGATVGDHAEDEQEISMITIQHGHQGSFREDDVSPESDNARHGLPTSKTWPQQNDSVMTSFHEHRTTRVVVGVSSESSCRDAIRWAVSQKVSGPWDTLTLLHVVSKIPQSSIAARRSRARPGEGMLLDQDVKLFQSEVAPNVLKHYIKHTVEPMLEDLKGTINPQVRVQVKVGRHNTLHKGILEEAKKLQATSLVLGTKAKGLFSFKAKASHTGTLCAKYRPHGMSVYIIHKDTIVLSEESNDSPCSSICSSPGLSVGTPETLFLHWGSARNTNGIVHSASASALTSMGNESPAGLAGTPELSIPDKGEHAQRHLLGTKMSAKDPRVLRTNADSSKKGLRHCASAISLATMEDDVQGKLPGSDAPPAENPPVPVIRSQSVPPAQPSVIASSGEGPSSARPQSPQLHNLRATQSESEVDEEEAKRELETLKIRIAKAELARLEAEICVMKTNAKLEAATETRKQ